MASFNNRFEMEFSMRTVENIFCKAFRLRKNGKDKAFCDLLYRNQLLFRFGMDDFTIIHPNGNQIKKNGAIFNEFPFNGQLLTMTAIKNKSARRKDGWDYPDDIFVSNIKPHVDLGIDISSYVWPKETNTRNFDTNMQNEQEKLLSLSDDDKSYDDKNDSDYSE